jgi:LacI family transcriptional regulator
LLASFIASNPAGPFAGRELCHFVDFVKPPDVLAWALKAKPDAILLSHEIKGLEGLPAHPKISWKLRLASLNRISRDPLFPGIDQRQDLIASYACDLVIEQLNRNEFGVPRHPKVVLVEGEWKELAGR